MIKMNLITRVSDGSVFSVDAGFQIHLGQAEEFPLLEVCDHSFLRPHRNPPECFVSGKPHLHLPWKEAQHRTSRHPHHHQQRHFTLET